ncbi:MAG: right-handed parallel beta-helix repeat-containing protein [Candidatus Eisenbacteria bacterium]
MSGGSTINAAASTGSSRDARAWFLISADDVTLRDLTFDGTGFSIYQAVRCINAGLTVDGCTFQNIAYSTYIGFGMAIFENASVTDCTFSNIERVGVILFGANVTAGLVDGCTFTGKGVGDWLDYAVELGAGAVATVSNNTVTGNRGVASSDGSTSAGMLITTYFGAGTTGDFTGNVVTDSSYGIYTGYDAADVCVATLVGNDLSGNDNEALVNTSTVKTDNASGNW